MFECFLLKTSKIKNKILSVRVILSKIMKTNQEDTNQESSESTPDLSVLSGLNFGPSWAEETTRQNHNKEFSGQKQHSKKNRSSSKRDRRNSFDKGYRKDTESNKTTSARENATGKYRRHNLDASQQNGFQPAVEVNIYPEDEAFEALVKRLRSTARTYQLFEIAKLILEKPERYVVAVQNKAKKDENSKPLYFTMPEYLPFETEEAAINYILNNRLDLFFEIEAIEIEPPKGNFQVVNRCTVTGELLGPPNYHRYQEFLQRHYGSKIHNMPFERFLSKVESVKEQESIDAWIESMKKGARYTLKDHKEGEPESFESLESVRSFLLQHRKDAIIGTGETVRFAGRDIERLPKGMIRRSVEMYIEHQQSFPLDTANNIRGRLRRHKFTVYKKGSKGIAYVCAVKRKFRDSKTVFSPSIQKLIEFIEKNPNLPAAKLPGLYLGIDVEKTKPEKLEMNAPQPAEEQDDVSDAAVDEVNKEDAVRPTEGEEPASPDVKASVIEMTPKSEQSEEDLKSLNQLMLNLHWLITAGYVTEYGEGHLFAPPPMPEPKPKDAKSKDSTEAEVETAPEKTNDKESEAALPSEKVSGKDADESTP